MCPNYVTNLFFSHDVLNKFCEMSGSDYYLPLTGLKVGPQLGAVKWVSDAKSMRKQNSVSFLLHFHAYWLDRAISSVCLCREFSDVV